MSNIEYSKLKASIDNLRREYETQKFVQRGGLQDSPRAHLYDFEKTTNNSVIKSFEICYETMWVHLKKYLEDERGLSEVPSSPIQIFRLAHESGTISKDMGLALIRYNKVRVSTAHDYSKKKSESVLDVVNDFIENMTELHAIISVS